MSDKFSDKTKFIEKINIGIVINDDSEFIDIALNILNKREEFKEIITIEKSTLEEAIAKTKSNYYAGYGVLPKDFVKSIITGENIPAEIVVNESMILESEIIKMIINASMTFLNTSQSGIYSTIDYASEVGFSQKQISDLIIPINLEYKNNLLNFAKWFNVETVSYTGSHSAFDYYIRTFSVFYCILFVILFAKKMSCFINKNVISAIFLSKNPLNIYLIKILISLYLIVFLCFLPFILIYNWYYLLFSFAITIIIFGFSTLFKDSKNSALSIIYFGVASLFFSGGIIPIAFFPSWLSFVPNFTINYYLVFIESNLLIIPVLCLVILSLSVLKIRKSD